MENGFCLRLLDLVQVKCGGQVVRGFESQKALALLCYLVVQGHPIRRSQLADMFWPSKSERRGRGNLSRVLSGLRGMLPGCVQADHVMVSFAPPEGYWVDVFQLQACMKRGTIADYAAAAALYRCDFMTGFFLNDCSDFETWLIIQQEYWRQQVVNCLLRLIEHHTFAAEGNHEQGLAYAEALLAIEPWREEAHRNKMRLLALSGQRSAALAHYRVCRALLARELGVEPSAETARLFELIRDGQVTSPQARSLLFVSPATPGAHRHATSGY